MPSLPTRGGDRDPIFLALAVADGDLGIPEADILDPQAHALHEPEPGTVEDPRHEGVATVPLRQDRPHLGFGQDHRHPRRALRALDVVQPFDLPPEDSL